MKGGFSKASELEVEVSQQCIEKLKNLVLSHILRRTKQQLEFQCKLPARKEYIVFCPLTDNQLMIYSMYVRHCLRVFDKQDLFHEDRK